MFMISKRTVLMITICVSIAIIGVSYAAFVNTYTINATTTGVAGSAYVVLTNCSGTGGAGGVSATCTPSGSNTSTKATCAANFTGKGVGSSAKCTYSIKNSGNITVKVGTPSCSVSGDIGTNYESGKNFYYKYTTNANTIAPGATLSSAITIEIINYYGLNQSLSGSVTCTFPYSQTT